MNDYSNNQRHRFAEEIHTAMKHNKHIIVLTGDLGYRIWDRVRKDYPNRFINAGAGEQALLGIAIGLALEGKIPIVFSITPFLLYRPFETIRNYINQEKIPVKLVGSGRNKDYIHDGFSHWCTDDKKVMKLFSNITSRWPKNAREVSMLVPKMLKDKNPWYINLSR